MNKSTKKKNKNYASLVLYRWIYDKPNEMEFNFYI